MTSKESVAAVPHLPVGDPQSGDPQSGGRSSAERLPGEVGSGESQSDGRTAMIGWLLSGALLLAQAPLLIEHFCNMLLRPHYQFALMLPFGVALLVWRGLRPDEEAAAGATDEPVRPGRLWVWLPLMLAALGILACATVYRSPWLAMVSFLLTSLGWIWFRGGWLLFRRMWPAWLVMWAALPLPQNLDVRLIEDLRTIATRWSSAVLDELGVMHLVSGNVIQLPGKSLFIADACTGIHSLFVLVAAALFIGLWLRRPLLHIVCLMASTAGIVLVENVSRICAVAVANSYGLDWSEGWRHTLLGLVLFAFSLVFILSTDSLLRFLHFLSPRNLIQTVRRLRQHRRLGTEFDRELVLPQSQAQPLRVAPMPTSHWAMLAPFVLMFGVLGLFQLSWMPTRAEQLGQQLRKNPVAFPEFGSQALPEQWNGWRRVDYQVATRVVEDPMGEHSQSWVYERDGRQAEISLDYPYRSLHDLTSCYHGFGWEMVDRAVVREEHTDPYVVAHMNRPLHGNGLLFYSHYDLAGTCDVELKEELSLGQLLKKRTDFGLPWFQIQLLNTSSLPVDEQQERELQELFFEIRAQLVAMCLKSINKEPHDG